MVRHRLGLLALVAAAYLLRRRRSSQEKATSVRAQADSEPSVMSRVGSATAPSEEIPPSGR
jgi:hypothetical protein